MKRSSYSTDDGSGLIFESLPRLSYENPEARKLRLMREHENNFFSWMLRSPLKNDEAESGDSELNNHHDKATRESYAANVVPFSPGESDTGSINVSSKSQLTATGQKRPAPIQRTNSLSASPGESDTGSINVSSKSQLTATEQKRPAPIQRTNSLSASSKNSKSLSPSAEGTDTKPKRPSNLQRANSIDSIQRSNKSSDTSSAKHGNHAVNKDFDYDMVFPENRKNDVFLGSNEAVITRAPSFKRQASNKNLTDGKVHSPRTNSHSDTISGHSHNTPRNNKSPAKRVSLTEFMLNRIYSWMISIVPVETSVFGTLPPKVQVGIMVSSAVVLCLVFVYLFVLNFDHYSNFRYVVFDSGNTGYNNGLDYLSSGGYGQSICTLVSKSIGTESLSYYECRNNSYHVVIMTLGLTTACTLLFVPFVVLMSLPLLYLYLHTYHILPRRTLYYKQSKKAALDEFVENVLKHRDGIPDESRKESLLKDLVSELMHKVLHPHHSHHRSYGNSGKRAATITQSEEDVAIAKNSPNIVGNHTSTGATEANRQNVRADTSSSDRTAIIERFAMSSSNTIFLLGDDQVLNTNNMPASDIAAVIENLQRSMGGFEVRRNDTHEEAAVLRRDEVPATIDDRDHDSPDYLVDFLPRRAAVASHTSHTESPRDVTNTANVAANFNSPLNISVNTVNIISVDDVVNKFIADKYSEYMESDGFISDTNANSESLDSEDEASNVSKLSGTTKFKVKNVRFEDFEDVEPESHVIDITMPSKLPSFDDIPSEATPVKKIIKRRYYKRSGSSKKSSPNAESKFTKPRSSTKKSPDRYAQEENAGLGGWLTLFLPATPTSSDKNEKYYT